MPLNGAYTQFSLLLSNGLHQTLTTRLVSGSLDDIIEMTSFGIIVYVMMWNIQIIFRGFNYSIFTNFSTPSRKVCPSLVLHRWRFFIISSPVEFFKIYFCFTKVFLTFFRNWHPNWRRNNEVYPYFRYYWWMPSSFRVLFRQVFSVVELL